MASTFYNKKRNRCRATSYVNYIHRLHGGPLFFCDTLYYIFGCRCQWLSAIRSQALYRISAEVTASCGRRRFLAVSFSTCRLVLLTSRLSLSPCLSVRLSLLIIMSLSRITLPGRTSITGGDDARCVVVIFGGNKIQRRNNVIGFP